MDAIAEGKPRVLLTMATGTGKTAVAFQIAWKLFQSRWTLQHDGKRRPRILFLADRNYLANQPLTNLALSLKMRWYALIRRKSIKKARCPPTGYILYYFSNLYERAR
jgi:type I restriction enzyme R subunit